MAKHMRVGTKALQKGFKLLKKDPAKAEMSAQVAIKAERNVEKFYRKALAELFNMKVYTKATGNDKNGLCAEVEVVALEHVMETFKRREIYRHMSNAADRLARTGNTLHDIIVKLV